MKLIFHTLFVLICAFATTLAHANVTNIYLDDTGVGAEGNNVATPVADPLGVNGTVAAITNLSSQFTNRNSGAVALPVDAVSYELSFDYYIPMATGLTPEDLIYLQVDLDGTNSGSAGFVGGAPTAGWNTISLSGALAGTENDIRLLAIVVDGGFGGTPDYDNTNNPVAFYLDNISVNVSTNKIPEPATTTFLMIAGMGFLARRRR